MESFETRTKSIHTPKKEKNGAKSKKPKSLAKTKKVVQQTPPKKAPRKKKVKQASCEEDIIDGFVISAFKSLAEMMEVDRKEEEAKRATNLEECSSTSVKKEKRTKRPKKNMNSKATNGILSTESNNKTAAPSSSTGSEQDHLELQTDSNNRTPTVKKKKLIYSPTKSDEVQVEAKNETDIYESSRKRKKKKV